MLRLDRLAPGDVAAVVGRYELWDETPGAGELYRCLAAEVAAKEPAAGTGAANWRSNTAANG